MKTLKVEEVYLMEYKPFEDVALPYFIHEAAPLRARIRSPVSSNRSTLSFAHRGGTLHL